MIDCEPEQCPVKFEEEVRKALEDGVINDAEMEILNTMREKFDIDDEFQANLVKSILRQRSYKTFKS